MNNGFSTFNIHPRSVSAAHHPGGSAFEAGAVSCLGHALAPGPSRAHYWQMTASGPLSVAAPRPPRPFPLIND